MVELGAPTEAGATGPPPSKLGEDPLPSKPVEVEEGGEAFELQAPQHLAVRNLHPGPSPRLRPSLPKAPVEPTLVESRRTLNSSTTNPTAAFIGLLGGSGLAFALRNLRSDVSATAATARAEEPLLAA